MATTKRPTASAKSSRSTPSGSSSKRTTKASTRSTAKAYKTGSKTAHGKAHKQASTDQHSENPSSTGHGKAKKQPARQTSRCWPGYEPVPGMKRGEKGSCKPKPHQTASEKKSDAMAAAGSKLHKAGGSKAQANHSK